MGLDLNIQFINMRDVLQFDEVNSILQAYYEPVMSLLDKAMADYNKLYTVFDDDMPTEYKGRTKGSFINCRLKARMMQYFRDDKNVKIVDYRGIFGIIVSDRIFIRFNKMDSKFNTSINKKTQQTQRFMQQAELNGFPSNVSLVWGGYNPDTGWTSISGYYLVSFNSGVEWHYDMGRNVSSQQLALPLQPVVEEQPKKRVTPKKRTDQGDTKTGTNNQ